MLVAGDADYVAELFQDLSSCLHDAVYLGGVDRESAVNEFKSLIVDFRRLPVDYTQISDVFQSLNGEDSYQCRTHAKRVIRLVRVIVCPAPEDMPEVDISVSGTHLSPAVMRSGIGCVQFFVLQSKFVPNDLLTVECQEELELFFTCGSSVLVPS